MSNHTQRRIIGLFITLLALFSLSAAVAQDSVDEQPLLKMLARIPNISASRTELYFNDRKAIETAYPPAAMPANWADYQAYRDDDGKSDSFMPQALWWKVWINQSSAMTARNALRGEDTPAVVGFDYFQIEQEMTYGTPPAQTLQLAGHFNLDTVRAAFTARGYAAESSYAELWCPEAGCEAGTMTNLRERNPANPFGGELGRSQPLLIENDALISSADETTMYAHMDVVSGDEQSLADLPQYRAAVEALTQNGVLMQAYFWDGELLAAMSQLDPMMMTASPEQRKPIIEAILKDYEPLPIYNLLAFGDSTTDTDMTAKTVLVYANEDDANKAAEILPKRIATYTSLVSRRPLGEILTDRGVAQADVQVLASNGQYAVVRQYAVVISFTTAKTSIDDILAAKSAEEGGSVTIIPPGSMYRYLTASALQRDLGWLNTIPREVLEAAAK